MQQDNKLTIIEIHSKSNKLSLMMIYSKLPKKGWSIN